MFFKCHAGGFVFFTFNLEEVYSAGLFWRWCIPHVYSGSDVLHTFIL
jgi:hypothetical protein